MRTLLFSNQDFKNFIEEKIYVKSDKVKNFREQVNRLRKNLEA